jgi:hypothetical protein
LIIFEAIAQGGLVIEGDDRQQGIARQRKFMGCIDRSM